MFYFVSFFVARVHTLHAHCKTKKSQLS